ncbi:hypothetical protein GCM10010329_19050 [Streptomyces spiroverticillatus]|uniref:Uncharacterized protein n=1 Tax=Streptomyces finlayi TaxID=67296 RepID=A0A918WTV0_9ACTN|nr:hypothetical protein [Streptomyces finlayi]GGZ97903.1 hypothetical protein GCM10010329_19050 [Streptomyces spiroverticillatus]GHC82897.1 hypothetical protein GCM10010334_11530 [Streptomyces finlayi]
MRYDQERTQQPHAGPPGAVQQRAPQAPGTPSGTPPGTDPAHARPAGPARTGHSRGSDDLAQSSVLLLQGDRDQFTLRLQQALNTFVADPGKAVQEADSVFDEAVTQLTETLAERRRTLRASWQHQETDAQTENLRLALRQYQDSTEQLLRI